MKKINGIQALSAHQQLEIMRWYIISKRILVTLVSLLIAITVTQWYILRRYAPTCKPCITQSYANTIGKKHAEKIGCVRNKKMLETEQEHGRNILKQYTSLLASHLNQSSQSARLTELRLTSQGFDAHYIAHHRSALEKQLKELAANPAINTVSLNTIEQKNNTVMSLISGTWKMEKSCN